MNSTKTLEPNATRPSADTDSESRESHRKYSSSKIQTGDEERKTSSPSPALLPQIIGGGVAALVQINLGMVFGYSGVTIPQLTSNSTDQDVFLDQHQVALFSSLVFLAGAIGCVVGILPTIKFGQRVTMLICLPLLFMGWIALSFSTTVWMIQTSRFLMGLTIGVTESSSYQYVTEISHCSIRGKMVGTLDTMRQTGVLLVFILGTTNHTWQEISLICGCTSIIPVFVALLFLPNSPRWLITHGRLEEASKSLSFYRGPTYDVTSELNSITFQISQSSGGKELSTIGSLKLLLEKTVLRLTIMLSILFLAAQFTGNIVVVSYIVPIFELTQVNMSSYLSAILVCTIRIIGTIFSLIYIDSVGRRSALFISFFLCGLSLASLGSFFYIKSQFGDITNLHWLPLTSLVIFTFFACVGHPTLMVVRGELLPTSVRSAAMPFLGFVLFAGIFLTAETFPIIVSWLEEYGAFWLYSGVCFCMAFTTFAIIPETRNKNLENVKFEKFNIELSDKYMSESGNDKIVKDYEAQKQVKL